MIEAIVVNRLIKWAKYKLKTDAALGYPKQSAFRRLAPASTQFRDPQIDLDCLLTNDAVNLLPEVYKLIIRIEYIDALQSMEQKAMVYGKSRREYGRDRERAYLLVGNLMDALITEREKIKDSERYAIREIA